MPISPVSSREVRSTPASASAPYFPINSPLHSVSSTPSEATTDRQVDQLWNDLERETCRTFVVNTNVDTAYADVPCISNANLITVKTNCADALPEPIHAHYIQQQHTDPVNRTKTTQHCYAAGQSPVENCTNFLIQGLDSGQGIYQFVSRKAHLEGVGKGGKTIIKMLSEQNVATTQPWLSDRYQALNFKWVKGHSENEDYVQYELEALDRITGLTKTVLLTQAGLKFTDHILQPDQIVHSNQLFQEHLDWLQANASANLSTAHGPLVVSKAGIGRNAVLITYRDMCTRIDAGAIDKNTLDTILKEVILAGRNSRGPKFLHSKLQLKALREALLTKLAQHQKPSPSFMQRARELFLNNLPSFGQDAQQSHAKSPTPRAASQSSLLSSSPSSNSSGRRSTIAPFFPEVEPAIPAQAPRPTNNVPAKPQTTLDDLADMQVGGIVVSASASSKDPELVKKAQAVSQHTQQTRETSIVRYQPADQTRPLKHLIGTSWQPWEHGHHYVPEKLQKKYEAVLHAAEKNDLTSIGFGADLIASDRDVRGPSPGTEKKPSARAAAIAVVTATRHLTKPDAKLKSILFQCKTDQQKSLYDDLIANEGQLSQHRTYQALLRDPIHSPTEATDPQDFFDPNKLAVFTPQVVSINDHNRPQPLSPPPAVEGTLNGIAFTSAKTNQQTSPSWSTHLGNFDEGATDHLTAAGTVIVEGSGDGRVWVVAPTNRFMRLENTFPKGQIDRDMTGPTRARETAVKEAWEESGLEVELVGVLCDAGMGDSTRYYLAKRIGGTPEDVGWESQAVKLVPRKKLLDVFPMDGKHRRDRYVAEQLSSHFDRNARSVALNSAANIDIRRTRRQRRPPSLASSAPLPQPGSPVEAGIHQMKQQIHNFTAFDANDKPDINFNTAASHLSEAIGRDIWHWRESNLPLVADVNAAGKRVRSNISVVARGGSQPPHQVTALSTSRLPGEPHYLHANYVDFETGRSFIAAQRPVTSLPPGLNYSDTFWRTVLKENLALIVDLTEEGEKRGESHYGPVQGRGIDIDTHRIELMRREALPDAENILVEKMSVFDKTSLKVDELTRLHFTGWVDKTAISARRLIELADQVGDNCADNGGRVLVHCSHGVGRTGSLITFMAASARITNLVQEHGGQLPIETFLNVVLDVLAKGRTERGTQFVSTTQFPLVLDALLKKHFRGIEGNKLIARTMVPT